jgi:hypothetical protein
MVQSGSDERRHYIGFAESRSSEIGNQLEPRDYRRVLAGAP